MSEQAPVRYVARLAAALLVALTVGCVIELWQTWPEQSPGLAFTAVLLLQIVALTALWAIPVAAAAAAALVMARRVMAGDRDLSWLLVIPPGAFACITVGQVLYVWGTRAFVRQDLAGAVVPVLQLAVVAMIAGACYLVHRAARGWLGRMSPRLVLIVFVVASVALAGAHLARFSAVTKDPMFPVLLQILGTGLVAIAGASLPDRWSAFRRVWPAVLGAAAVLALLAATSVIARFAPFSYPMTVSALQQRGLAAARAIALTPGIGDSDRDGFSAVLGGDCNDHDAAIHPLAKDVPGDGIDQDCFEGDESKPAIAADAAERKARRGLVRQRVRNLVFITVDALRADAVGFGGQAHPTTPALDALAARSAVFSRMYTAAPMTRRAFPSLLAGRYPSNVHWLDLQTSYIYTVSAPENVFMAEALSQAGLKTASVLAFGYAQRGRFDQGFQSNTVHPASQFPRETNANRVVDDAIRRLKSWGQDPETPRFFLWLHFYEAHYPYERHKGIDFGDSEHQRYLGEVRWIDDQLARLFAELTALGLADDTAIVFTADHGEEFGEHGGTWHGDLYPEDLHVPLLVHVPGGAPRAIDAPVSLVDIAPTILDLLGVPVPAGWDGDSLVPFIEGETPPADRFAFAEVFPDVKVPRRLVTLIERDWQLIVDFQLGVRELFDLRKDPGGLHNALIDAPAEAQRLEQRLRRHLARRVGPLRVSKAKTKDKGNDRGNDNGSDKEE
jgi:arylsulfatase A-like enzyme